MARKSVFFALISICSIPAWAGSTLGEAVGQLERDWAQIYYALPEDQQAEALKPLLQRAERLRTQYPNKAEPLIWKAILLCTQAGAAGGLTALATIGQAHDLLKKAANIDPKALDGSAYVTLGTLYYMVPGWPIGFGDDKLARRYFEMALEINPNGIESNYFYGDYLLSQGEEREAIAHFNKALAAPVRPDQTFADEALKKQVTLALTRADESKLSGFRAFFKSLFSSAQAKP